MSVVSEIMGVITGFLTGIFTALVDGITELSGVFYDSTDGLTFIGTIAFLGLAIGFVSFIVAWLRGMIK